jgi:hypothetical protein
MFEELNLNIDTLLDIRKYLIEQSKLDSIDNSLYYKIEIGVIDFLLTKYSNEITEGFTSRLESSSPGK